MTCHVKPVKEHERATYCEYYCTSAQTIEPKMFTFYILHVAHGEKTQTSCGIISYPGLSGKKVGYRWVPQNPMA